MKKGSNKKIRKVGIGFITGRKNFQDVLTTYLKCWGSRILVSNEIVNLSLFVAYDLEYQNTQRNDYINIKIELREMLTEIVFIDHTSIQYEVQILKKQHVLTEEEAQALFEKGYAGQRNAIMYYASKCGMDAILFLDDDEYPLAVKKSNGNENWSGQQILSSHLAYIDQADITCGYHCGYISPIPNLIFNQIMSEADFRLFIEAISNDIINWNSIKDLMQNGNITYADEKILDGAATEVAWEKNAKFITGSNLCINLQNLSRINPFYNPPAARGEDTFLSTCLQNNVVFRVPCYTFHDGFTEYTSLLHGVLPQQLKQITNQTAKITARFYATCIGWIRYKPLLIYITQPEEYQICIDGIRKNLKLTLPILCNYFNEPKFMKIEEELNKYDKHVQKHFKAFQTNQISWQKIVAHLKIKIS